MTWAQYDRGVAISILAEFMLMHTAQQLHSLTSIYTTMTNEYQRFFF